MLIESDNRPPAYHIYTREADEEKLISLDADTKNHGRRSTRKRSNFTNYQADEKY